VAQAKEIRFDHGDTGLAGTLHLPNGKAPYPAIIMLQGSGPADRDSGGYFPPIRNQFLESGLAVLSWDKPGIGESTGHWTNMTLFDRADEALTAVAWLRRQEGIDPTRVGIWGHSQGGWVGPLTASQTTDLAFLIVNSGPAIDPLAQDLWGVEHTLRDEDADQNAIDSALKFMSELHSAAIRGDAFAQVQQSLLTRAKGQPGFEYFGDFGPEQWNFLVINAQRLYDPIPPLEKISCPTLAIFGERDPLVPVEFSAETFERSRASDPNRDITVRVFPEADHRIKVGEAREFAPGYLDAMTSWIWSRIGSWAG
jgi:hypothetical protein